MMLRKGLTAVKIWAGSKTRAQRDPTDKKYPYGMARQNWVRIQFYVYFTQNDVL
jgi:hypothetical protein